MKFERVFALKNSSTPIVGLAVQFKHIFYLNLIVSPIFGNNTRKLRGLHVSPVATSLAVLGLVYCMNSAIVVFKT